MPLGSLQKLPAMIIITFLVIISQLVSKEGYLVKLGAIVKVHTYIYIVGWRLTRHYLVIVFVLHRVCVYPGF